ncbi:hypothetical protein SKAU_G00354610 [Synaphobranchus kaupii]|uniref:Dynein regulatory complex protein 1 C-terminal domain-containing protein n=1 Tax=Synaphobranchus kaupii TaxID=118154 RepID=A0A9Q1EH33_SYNKA|nr:hypothetical protein SKAU_G00354610 [Synaphobranchus kaupii]
MKKIQKMQFSIAQLRSRLTCSQRKDCEERQALGTIREEVTVLGRHLNAQLNSTLSRNRCQLTVLTMPYWSTRGLESVWHRYNKVLLERLCLIREQAVLGQHNGHLRLMLRRYLAGHHRLQPHHAHAQHPAHGEQAHPPPAGPAPAPYPAPAPSAPRPPGTAHALGRHRHGNTAAASN